MSEGLYSIIWREGKREGKQEFKQKEKSKYFFSTEKYISKEDNFYLMMPIIVSYVMEFYF